MASKDPTSVHHAVDLMQTQDVVVEKSQELIDSLRDLTLPEKIDEHDVDIWDLVLQSMLNANLLDFPTPEVGDWNSCIGMIQYAEVISGVLYAILGRKEDIYVRAAETLKGLFSQLFPVMYKLDLWLEGDEAATATAVLPGLISPLELRGKVLEAMAQIGIGVVTSQGLQVFFDELLGQILEFVERFTSSAASFSYPMSIDWFCRSPQTDNKQRVNLQTPFSVTTVLVTTLETFLQMFFRRLSHQYVPHNYRLSLLGGLKSLFDYCMSSSCFPDATSRHRFLSRLLQAHEVVSCFPSGYRNPDVFHYMATRILEYRMDGILHADVGLLDATLKEYLHTSPGHSPNRLLVIQASSALRGQDGEQQNEDLVSLAVAYLRNCIKGADENALRLIQTELKERTGPEANALRNEMQQPPKKATPTQGSSATQVPSGKVNMKDHVWRPEIRKLVASILSPEPLAWMDEEFRPNEAHFIRRVLSDVSERFSRPLERVDAASRIRLAQEVGKLPCLLTLCSGEDCFAFRKEDGFPMVHHYVPVLISLLRGDDEQVTPAVKRTVFKAMRPILKHRNEEDPGNEALDLIFQGFVDHDRSTRLSAGMAMGCVLQYYVRYVHRPGNVTAPLFDRMYRQIDSGPGPVKETLVVSVGKMGLTATGQTLSNVICLLVAQLGRPATHSMIRSLACTQILSIAKHRNKTTYSLMLPFMDDVAPLIVARLCSQPSLLQETCKLMAVAPTDFLAINLQRTLPDLLVRCDMQNLDMLAKHLEQDRATLIVAEGMHTHLAPIFMLKSPAAASRSLGFILGILNEASKMTIDLRQVLPACTTALLTEIVVMLGDENPNMHALVKAAIQRVETALKTGQTQPILPGLNPGVFLASQMLGIISRIIDTLQDVHGKKSLLAKRKIIRSLGALVELIGPPIHSVASQIMATFQTMIAVPELAEVTVDSWVKFLITLNPEDLGPHLGATCAAFVCAWPNLSTESRNAFHQALLTVFSSNPTKLQQHIIEIVDLSVVEQLVPIQEMLNRLRGEMDPHSALYALLARCSSNNIAVATLSLSELRKFMQVEHRSYIQSMASGDVFEPTIGRILTTLYKAACRDGEGAENLRLLAYECIGVLGAVDPYRFEMASPEVDMVVTKNFTEEGETMTFVLHLIQDLLVDAFRSTSDIKYQTNLAYPIQELLKHCGFTSDLVNSGRSAPMKIRTRWNSMPKDVLGVVTPLLEGRFAYNPHSSANSIRIPVYPTQSTYREWLQVWTTYLISKVAGQDARNIFKVFLSVVRSKDVMIAKHLLPHLVLNVLISGSIPDAHSIRDEINVVLLDQVNSESTSTTDKKLLSAQAIFALLDHLNKWARLTRREIGKTKAASKRARASHISHEAEEQLIRLDSILSTIDPNLMARAAFQCKAYARSLMSFEQQILQLRMQSKSSKNLEEYYDRLHEIYAHLDEPDGMEGVSPLILSPSLEHQIREHESTGKWTAAQSCWEVRLQHSPDNLDFHLGLLRCLRNLGHYDTLRNHVKGVLTNHPEWEPALADFHAESSWMVGAWDDINSLLSRVAVTTPGVAIAQVLLAMRRNDPSDTASALAVARRVLGAPITASGVDGYRRTYGSALHLHMTHELEIISDISRGLSGSRASQRKKALVGLERVLKARLEATLPTFRSLEPVLSMRRVAFSLMPSAHPDLAKEVGSTWLASAKIARKAGHWQTAYSATLQARQHGAELYFIESAKLYKATGEPTRALQELETFMKSLGLVISTGKNKSKDSTDTNSNSNNNRHLGMIDLTDEDDGRVKGKLHLLRARWMDESERCEAPSTLEEFRVASEMAKDMESACFYFGNFYDKCYKELKPSEVPKRGIKMNMFTIRHYARAIRLGSKFIYHTVPRLLTLWLDNGEDKSVGGSDVFAKINEIVASAIKDVPPYKWFTAFPQIVSRVGHNADKVYQLLATLIVTILQEYPRQALWGFASVVRSTKAQRETRGRAILEKLRSTPSNNKHLSRYIADSVAMTGELLGLCDRHVEDERKTMSMSRDFPKLKALGHCELLIPLQESLTVNLPSSSSAQAVHQPFPGDAPTFHEFADEIEIMKSLAKPRKVTIQGSDGLVYMFLGKPKDDLRKDARLMDFNSIINKLLKTNSDARRRQLHIRTYGVVTLNEECGFIQWVPNTVPVRPVLLKYYEARKIKAWTAEMGEVFRRIKLAKDAEAAEMFTNEVLPHFPPVFHEWFIETFPEPTAWLASRLSFGRTAAVMSMVGYILGLGDRHCENILLDVNTGDVIHVDFNCLFEKGKLLETPERVPFRLTQNIVDGLGVTGVEGVFRIACELTMNLLRENKDSLMSVLDAFVHDPLVEWEDEKRKRDRNRNQPKASTESIAKNALEPIGRKLEGYYDVAKAKHEQTRKLLSTASLVEALIQEAMSLANLAKMYPGWAAWN